MSRRWNLDPAASSDRLRRFFVGGEALVYLDNFEWMVRVDREGAGVINHAVASGTARSVLEGCRLALRTARGLGLCDA